MVHLAESLIKFLLTISQMSTRDKTGLRYGTQINELSSNSKTDSKISLSVFDVRSSDEEIIPTNDMSFKVDRFHAVPPPITGNFLTLRADISFAGLDEFAIRRKVIESQTTKHNTDTSKTKTSENLGNEKEVNAEKPKSINESIVSESNVNNEKVIIKDWTSDDEDEVSDVQTVCHVKSRETQTTKIVRTNVSTDRSNISTGRPKVNPAMLVSTARPCVSTARPSVSTARQNVSPARLNVYTASTVRPFVLKIAQTGSAIRPIYQRMDNVRPRASSLPINRSYYPKPAYRPNNLKQDVKSIWVQKLTTTRTRAVVNAGNKAYLSDYEDYNGGFVAFGSDPKGDKKNSVLFTESECLILSPSFKLLDESQVVLRAPRKDDVYSLDLKNIIPFGGITCLYANATSDEYKLWHRRLGHVNYKNINKLVKGNLVRGLPSKVFMNDHTCVACKKGKQHKASCKAKLERTIRKPLELLHMDLFGPVSVDNINKKRKESKGSLVWLEHHSKMVWQKERIEPSLRLLELSGTGPDCIFDLDFLTNTMNYIPVSVENQVLVDTEDDFDVSPNEGVFSGVYDDDNVGAEADFNNMDNTIDVSPIPTLRIHKVHPKDQILGDPKLAVQTRMKIKKASSAHQALISYIYKQNRTNHKDHQNYLLACFLSQEEPKNITQALQDESWVEAMQEELLQFKLQKVWVLVDLPYGKKVIGTKWVFRNKRDKRSIIRKNKARLVAQGFRHEEGIDYDEVFAPVTRIEAIRLFLDFASYMGFTVYQMDVKSAFLYGTIGEEVYVHQPPGFVDPTHPNKVYKVIKSLYGLHQAPRAWYETLSSFLLENGFRRDSDYGGASLDRKSTTGGCQLFGRRLISWQCKKQTIVANSTTEAEYVAVANYCGTKHIEIRFHFIRDCYEKRLIEVVKIHTDNNVADLLTKRFDVTSKKKDFDNGDAFQLVTRVLKSYWREFLMFWTSAKSQTINNVRYIKAKVVGKPVTISEASIRSDLLFDDADGIDVLNNQDIFDNIQLMGKVFSFMVKKGKHFSGNITPLFASMLVPPTQAGGEVSDRQSEPQPTPSPHPSADLHETAPDHSPRPSPSVPILDPTPEGSGSDHRGQSSDDRSQPGTEDDLTLKSVYDLSSSLCTHVTAQAAEIKTLKAQQLDKSKKRRSVSKQGRKTIKSSKGDPSVPTNTKWNELDDIDDTMDYILAQDEGKTDQVKEQEEGTVKQQSTDKPTESTDKPNEGTDSEKVSTDRVEEGTAEARDEQRTTPTTPTPTPTTFRDDETIAQVLLNISQAKAVSKEKEKGVEIKDVERPRITSTRSVLTPQPLPKIDPKDKGKKRIEEYDESGTESDEVTTAEK
ncbi:putative ribonuclease H-like domain-containing protein [Tanacetum coccineum]